MFRDYFEAMSECIDKLMEQYYNEVIGAMHTEAGRSDVKKERLDEFEKHLLIRKIIGGAHSILDSWGTGTLMDTSNPALNEYLSSAYYNPSRPFTPGAPITGRPEGEYTNIFGETEYSTGAMEGLNLEINPNIPITARSPSGAFQDADKWFSASNAAKDAISNTTKQFFSGVYRNPSKYMKFG